MRTELRYTAFLALPSLINAVALSDMTPRATGLSGACESIYTAQISGCGPEDFQTLQCSQSCIGALEQLVRPIQSACGGQGIHGQNLIVAFLAGVGPQQICHNINSSPPGWGQGPTQTTTSPQPTSTTSKQTKAPTPSIIKSTSTASTASNTKTLVVDSSSVSSSPAKTTSKHTTAAHTTKQTSSAAPTESSSVAAGPKTKTTAESTSTKTTSAGGNSQTNLNDGSGGGSPFDTPGNLASGASRLTTTTLSMLLPAIAAVLLR